MHNSEQDILKQINDLLDQYVITAQNYFNKANIKFTECIFVNTIPDLKNYLITNHYNILDFSLEIYQELPILLSKTLSFPNGNITPNQDHFHFWALCAEIILRLFNDKHDKITLLKGVDEYVKYNFTHNFEVLIHSNLCNLSVTRIPDRIARITDNHIESIVDNINTLSAFFSFALLEHIIRIKCKDYIEINGEIKKPFRVNSVNYGKSKGRKWISNLSHELNLLERESNENLKSKLLRFKNHLMKIDYRHRRDPYELIYEWRNTLLHGQLLFSTRSGIITNLICLIILCEIPHPLFESEFERIIRSIGFWDRIYKEEKITKPNWIFYPP